MPEFEAEVNAQGDPTECEMCGEKLRMDAGGWYALDEEVGEFYDPETGEHVIGHASCGIERGLEMA